MSQLKKPIHPMPEFARNALNERGLMEAYNNRPPYQRNDYLGWISRAKEPDTRDKRLHQILSELEGGSTYMKMAYCPRRSLNPFTSREIRKGKKKTA